MGFLDKLTKKKEEDELPIPPPPMPPGPMNNVPPMPSAADMAKSPDVPVHQEKLPEVSNPPLPEAAPAEMPSTPPAPEPEPAPQEAKPPISIEPQAEVPAAVEKSPEAPKPKMPPISEDELPIPNLEEKPKTTREDVRKAFSDVPPITVKEPKEEKSDEFDVDKLVIPKRQASQNIPMPEPDDNPLKGPPEPKPAPAPLPPSPAPMVMQDMAPPPVMQRAQGPLFISLHKYDRIQKSVAQLKKELVKLSADVRNIEKLKEKEDKEFGSIVAKLQHVQDELLSIDADLFEQ